MPTTPDEVEQTFRNVVSTIEKQSIKHNSTHTEAPIHDGHIQAKHNGKKPLNSNRTYVPSELINKAYNNAPNLSSRRRKWGKLNKAKQQSPPDHTITSPGVVARRQALPSSHPSGAELKASPVHDAHGTESDTMEEFIRRSRPSFRLEDESEQGAADLDQVEVEQAEHQTTAPTEQASQDEQLDEIDLELLNLGQRTAEPSSSCEVSSSSPARSPKRSRHSSPYASTDPYDVRNGNEDQPLTMGQQRQTIRKKTKGDAYERPQEVDNWYGKRPRKHREKQKQRKRPVDELIIVSKRLQSLHSDDNSNDSDERSQDPIPESSRAIRCLRQSQRYQKRSQESPSRLPRRRTFDVDTSKFRFPNAPDRSQREQNRMHRPTYSDGFEDGEARLTGRLMPMKQTRSRPQKIYRSVLWVGELTLISDKYFGSEIQPRDRRPAGTHRTRSGKKHSPLQPTDMDNSHEVYQPKTIHSSREPIDLRYKNPQEPNNNKTAIVADHKTPTVQISQDSALLTPNTSSLLSKLKPSSEQKEIQENELTFQQTQRVSTQSQDVKKLFQNGHDHTTPSATVERLLPKTQTKPKTPVAKLSMVSVPKSSYFNQSESDNTSEEGCEVDEDSVVEGDEEKDLWEDGLGMDKDSGDDGDVETVDEREDQDLDIEIRETDEDNSDLERDHQPVAAGLHYHHQYEGALENDDVSGGKKKTKIENILPEESLSGAIHADKPQFENCVFGNRSWKLRAEEVSNESIFGEQDVEEHWHLRKPRPSTITMEEDEEIFDSPSPIAPSQTSRARIIRRRGSRPLTTTSFPRSPSSTEPSVLIVPDSQGSVELGDPRKPARQISRAHMTQTYVEGDAVEPDEEPLSQQSFVPTSSYFDRASQHLQIPIQRTYLSRTKSMPRDMHYFRQEQNDGMMVGGITMSKAFMHTVSPRKSSGRVPSILEETATREKSLKALTRKASVGLGTLPASEKRRTVSMRFAPPFKKIEGD